ncbi:MAG: BREX-1 system adenine-specific DNA-methyltransferase PglX [Calditrichaeota bacterium]|nr:BREX-1 system adenine-specific DNA-methyltransferase PglX [Calditrichota bacterium]
MNTNKLKTFAQEARQLLMQGVENRLRYWGFDEKGQTLEDLQPTKGGYIFREQVFDDPDVPKKWQNLKRAVQRHTAKDIVEEAAYTWFNRLVAIKILEENNYIPPVLHYVSAELQEPLLLSHARKGQADFLKSNEKAKLTGALLENEDEQAFALLLSSYCKSQPLLKRVFGIIDDYTELLLPNNLLSSNGIIELLNNTPSIEESDYKELELIGWLYQFYISDKKDDVFAGFKKNKKARAEDIPAATQIFTPKWIVKYLVENTVGRIWLDRYPDSPLKQQMKYLVEPAAENRQKDEPIINDVSELKVLDPAVGSGHFLLVAFDLLLEMYKEEGYTPRNAAQQIIHNNLFGLDICKRAAQLANFAVLLKAAQYNPDILNGDLKPNIFAMPEPRAFSRQDVYDFLGEQGTAYADELEKALLEMQQAQNIGSALILDLSKPAHAFIKQRLQELQQQQQKGQLDLAWQAFYAVFASFIEPVLILTDKFHAVVANPPYMGGKSMNPSLTEYVRSNYPKSKSDLCTVFMEACVHYLINSGILGMINLPSWMFLSSYEKLRRSLLEKTFISTLIHQGRGIFGSDFGSVCFCVINENHKDRTGIYRRLFQQHVKVDSVEEKERRFFNRDYGFYESNQSNFEKIPFSPIGYWVSDKIYKLFEQDLLAKVGHFGEGLSTKNNDLFIRFWHEVNFREIGFKLKSPKMTIDNNSKFYPFHKGGAFRKWYGNLEYVVDFKNDGNALKMYKTSQLKNYATYFKRGLTWSKITSGSFSVRFSETGNIYGDAGLVGILSTDETLYYSIAFLNTKLAYELLIIINPTLNYTAGSIKSIPIIVKSNEIVQKLTKVNIEISKSDWDSNETSWDFNYSPLINKSKNIFNSYQDYLKLIKEDFFLLHTNEERLNRIFIETYNLVDELSPEVSLKDVTICQDELDFNNLEKSEILFREKGKDAIELPIKKDVVISQFLSYATGCFMGRYRLDKPGLNIAHPDPTQQELSGYSYNNHPFQIDEDAIIPMMGAESPFSDDVVLRVKEFVLTIWGEETLTGNLNFINDALGMDMEKFMVSKFWDFHKKMYKKKPIYWLFASPSKSFQVLVYMHRMNRFTIQKIRNNYLLKYLNWLNEQISRLQQDEASLSKVDARRLDSLRKALVECRAYDKLLKDFADKQIEFDLDDGVKVNHAKFEGIVVKI